MNNSPESPPMKHNTVKYPLLKNLSCSFPLLDVRLIFKDILAIY